MSINGKGCGFNPQNIAELPEEPGVFEFSQYNFVTYIGSADTSLRATLKRHLDGLEGFCTVATTWVKYEVAPADRVGAYENELLEEFRATHGQLPRCNDLSSWEPAGPSGVRGE
jgi:hypothetical protein